MRARGLRSRSRTCAEICERRGQRGFAVVELPRRIDRRAQVVPRLAFEVRDVGAGVVAQPVAHEAGDQRALVLAFVQQIQREDQIALALICERQVAEDQRDRIRQRRVERVVEAAFQFARAAFDRVEQRHPIATESMPRPRAGPSPSTKIVGLLVAALQSEHGEKRQVVVGRRESRVARPGRVFRRRRAPA